MILLQIGFYAYTLPVKVEMRCVAWFLKANKCKCFSSIKLVSFYGNWYCHVTCRQTLVNRRNLYFLTIKQENQIHRKISQLCHYIVSVWKTSVVHMEGQLYSRWRFKPIECLFAGILSNYWMRRSSADQGGCYTPRPKTKVDNTLKIFSNS